MMKVSLGHPGLHPIPRHGPRFHRFHGSRFPLSFFASRCHIPCMRVYTDSDTGSDIQQESLLDPHHHSPEEWDDADFGYPFRGHDALERSASPPVPSLHRTPVNGSFLNSSLFQRHDASSPSEPTLHRMPGNPYQIALNSTCPGDVQEQANIASNADGRASREETRNLLPVRNPDAPPASLDLWRTSGTGTNASQNARNDTSSSTNSRQGYGEFEDEDSTIESLPDDENIDNNTESLILMEVNRPNETLNEEEPPSLLDEILSSFNRRFRMAGSSLEEHPWRPLEPATDDPFLAESNQIELSNQSGLTSGNLPSNTHVNNNQDTAESNAAEHTPIDFHQEPDNSLFPRIPSPFSPASLPPPEVDSRSVSENGMDGNLHRDWYIYDPRLAPERNDPRIEFQTSFGGITNAPNPPDYEEALGSCYSTNDLPQRIHNWVMLSEAEFERGDLSDQNSDSYHSLPPPYQEEPPPTYEQSFHHRLLLSGQGYGGVDEPMHQENSVPNLSSISHLLRHIPVTSDGNAQSNILLRDTNTIFLPETEPVRIQDILQDSDSIRDSDLLQDCYLLEDNHDCGESTTDDAEHQLRTGSLPQHLESGGLGHLQTVALSDTSPHDTVRSHASSALQLSMSLRRYPVGSNLGQRPAIRWSRGIGVDRWAASNNWVI